MSKMGFGRWSGKMFVKFIPHQLQRYDTCGDWTLEENPQGTYDLDYKITETGDPKKNFCLLMHEVNESLTYLFKRNFDPAAVKAVDEFDMRYGSEGEPGFDPLCPCYAEHMYAMECEHGVAAQLALDWNSYSETLGALVWRPTKEEPF